MRGSDDTTREDVLRATRDRTKNMTTAGTTVPGRRDDIQGLRGVAVLSVIAYHASDVVPGGFVGVDMFFVVSGFVITAMLAREWARHGRIDLATFYVRRFKRLTPALTLMLSFTLIGAALMLAPMGAGRQSAQETAVFTALGAVFLTANVVIARNTGGYFDSAAATNPLLHTWSLSVEEQFYLVFPGLLAASWMAARHNGRRSHGAVLAVGFVGLVSLLLAFGGPGGPRLLPDSLVGFYGPATRVWEFAVGALLALGLKGLVVRSLRSATVVGVLGGAGLVVSLWLIDSSIPFPGAWTLLPVGATVLIILVGTQARNLVTRGLSMRPMVVVGDLSYSLYLWHWPFIVFATLLWPESAGAPALAAILSAVPAWASYHLVEQRFRRSRAHGPRLLMLVAATLSPPLLLAAGVFAAVDRGYWSDTVRRYQSAITTPHISAACTSQAWRKPAECTWNSDASGRPVYLVGDSNADHLSEAVLGGAEARDRPFVVFAQLGCTYAAVSIASTDPGVTDRCNAYFRGTEDTLLSSPRGTVVIANSYLWWTTTSDIAVGLSDEDATRDPAERLTMLNAGLSAAVGKLESAGHEVLIVQPIPHWGDDASSMDWDSCSILDMISAGCGVETEALEEARGRQGAIWQVVLEVSQNAGVAVLDVSSELCPEGMCASESSDGLVRYRDGTHITVQQSQALRFVFATALGETK